MTLASIASGAAVFLDANILVYHFSVHPIFGSACTDLVERIENREVSGFSSADVVRDVAHRLMTLEAISLLGWPTTGIAGRLRKHHNEIRNLTRFRQAVEEIPRLAIQVLPVSFDLVAAAAAISQQFELLSGDALVVAIMQQQGLINLASNDADFDRVAWLTRWTPA